MTSQLQQSLHRRALFLPYAFGGAQSYGYPHSQDLVRRCVLLAA
ncbi:hypothetical protein [Stenomitos frigidus]|nr:hypothetical protein [Stenomitos frigidus]